MTITAECTGMWERKEKRRYDTVEWQEGAKFNGPGLARFHAQGAVGKRERL